MAEAYGKLTGRPGDLLRHARPGRDPRVRRRAHRRPGLDAADPLRRPGAAWPHRPRCVPGARLPRRLRLARQVGGSGGRRLAHPRARCARVRRCHGEADPGRSCWRCPRTCSTRRPTRPMPAPTEIPRPGPGDEELRRLGELLAAAERPLVVVGEGGWTAQAGEDTVFFCEANAIPVVASFRCQDYVDNGSERVRRPADDRHGSGARAPRGGSRPPRRGRRAAGGRHDPRLHAARRAAAAPDARARPSRPGRARDASTRPTCPSSPTSPSSRPGCGGCCRSRPRAGAAGPKPRAPTTSPTSSRGRCPEISTSPR